jgi:hypothetical protein
MYPTFDLAVSGAICNRVLLTALFMRILTRYLVAVNALGMPVNAIPFPKPGEFCCKMRV